MTLDTNPRLVVHDYPVYYNLGISVEVETEMEMQLV